MRRRSLVPLSRLGRDRRAVVRELRDVDGPRMAHWKEVGLVPGAEVRVREVRPLQDVFEIDVAGQTLVTGSEGLEGVLVELPRARGPSESSAPRRHHGR